MNACQSSLPFWTVMPLQIHCWCDTVICLSVCPSVMLCIVAIAKVSEQVNRKCPLRNTVSLLSSLHWPSPKLSTANRRHCWCHLANTLKIIVNNWTAKISTSGIAIVIVLHGYSGRCSTSGFLSNSWASCYFWFNRHTFLWLPVTPVSKKQNFESYCMLPGTVLTECLKNYFPNGP